MAPSLAELDRRAAALLVAAAVLVGVLAVLAVGLQGGDDDRYEPNDDFEDAAAVERGVHEDLVLAAGDYDVYAVSLSAGQSVTATIRFEHDAGDLDLEAYDPEAEILARSDSITDDESLTVTAETSGTYFFLVYGREDAANEYGLELESPEPVATSD